MSSNDDKTIQFDDSSGNVCGVYHYDHPFKSFFRGLYTPAGKNVVAFPPPDHPHHHGLQFGLTTSDVNFWEEAECDNLNCLKIPAGTQHSTKLELLTPPVGKGFVQTNHWERVTETETVISFSETRTVSVKSEYHANVWTWETILTAATDVEIIKGIWPGPGYCGLGVRLDKNLFEGGKVLPDGIQLGETPASVSFQGKGVEITFAQTGPQKNAVFFSYYEYDPYFAFLSLGPTNAENTKPLILRKGEKLTCSYVITVADI